ncbi:ArsR/SmtB family transcription factor [Kordiimonas laminariae]|uniref:ArsR/SmtB family transcription factor n=1 Tax=Kordiimonas laminariae TaxID=2917717 RepID=UPI001FF3AAEF|nr:metalloregulator ArsR/SmtB family transcription factor [Kordiimonas laminariae]MCK0070660.1 metalloregulator ArsR/SmtB family transcription factor [Kordiimonas laminariae]
MELLLSALRAAAEATRLRILALLAKGELTVGELVNILDQSQPRVSRHLKLMCEAGVLDRFQEGTTVFYRLADQGKNGALNKAIIDLVPLGDPEFSKDLLALADIREERFEKAQSYFRENAASWGEIRSLHVAEGQVEEALIELQGKKQVSRLLDVGTGTGRMLELFAPYASQGLGLDVSREMLAVARGNLANKGLENSQVRQGDMYELGVGDASQDLVVFHQVLHFADEPSKAIKEAARALVHNGELLIADFAPHQEEFLRADHAHRRLGFAEEEMIQMGEQAGLACKAVKHLDGGKLRVTLWQFGQVSSGEE